jgi:hypothetical protein
MKKEIISLILLVLYFMGAIGGLDYAVFSDAKVISVAVLVLVGMAWPTARQCFKNLFE